MIFNVYIDLDDNSVYCNDESVTINSIIQEGNVVEIEISRPDEEFAPVGMI